MFQNIKKLAAVGVAAAALATLGPANTATAANLVPCDRNDFTAVTYHWNDVLQRSPNMQECWANGGYFMPPKRSWGGRLWVHEISSGNNVVWWEADGNWNRLPKWHVLGFPNHPGGVHVTNMHIGD